MIYPLSGLVLGAVLGAVRARLRDGNLADMLQWGAVFGILGALIGLFVLIGIERSYA